MRGRRAGENKRLNVRVALFPGSPLHDNEKQLLFVVVVQGESLGMRLMSESATKSTKRGMYEKYTPKEMAETSWYHSHI